MMEVRSREEECSNIGSESQSANSQYEADGRPVLTTNDALLYLREVKQRFSGCKDVYESFLDIMKEFKSNSVNISNVVSNVKRLLHGHEDLILGFNTFLPCSSQITLAELRAKENMQKPGVELDQAISYINRIKARFVSDDQVYKTFLEILCCFRQGRMDIHSVYREVSDLFQDHPDLLSDFCFFLPEHTSNADFNQLFHTPTSSSINDGSSPRSEESFNSSESHDANFRNEESEINYEEDLKFFDEVKTRIENPQAYNDLLKCLNLYARDVVTRTELIKLTQDVIGRYPDVMADFRRFISDVNYPFRDSGLSLRSREVRPAAGSFRYGNVNSKTAQMLQQKQNYLTKPVSELDTEDWERITTSYVKLPKDFPQLLCSGKTALGHEVLQEEVVSVTTGTEDESSRQMRKNHYEEALFKGEDERYEFELTMDRNRSAIQALLPLEEQIEATSHEDRAAFTLPQGVLKHFHISIIEKVYGEKAKQILELMESCPSATIPVVMCRLQQKDLEWERVRQTMMPHWQRIFDENYQKSLDHRSFQFKMNDKKTILPKTLIQDLKDACEEHKQSKAGILELSAATPEIDRAPHLTYSFADMDVFEDVYGVVRFSASKLLGSEIWRLAMHLWTDFIEPFFGIDPHSWDPEMYDTDTEKTKSKNKKISDEIREIVTDSSSPQEISGNSSDRLVKFEDMDKDSGKDSAEGRNTNEELELKYKRLEPLYTVAHTLQMNNIMEFSSDPDGFLLNKDKSVFYCNDMFYQLFRMVHILYSRLQHVKRCCRNERVAEEFSEENASDKNSRNSLPLANTVSPDTAEKNLDSFRSLLYAFMDNSIDNDQFEDCCRDLLGSNAYVLFTLDKLIPRLIKQLQAVALDPVSQKYLDLYHYEKARGPAAYSQACYLENVKAINHKENFIVSITFSHTLKQMFIRLEDIPLRIPEKMPVCRRRTRYTKHLINTEVDYYKLGKPEMMMSLFLSRNIKQRLNAWPQYNFNDIDSYDNFIKDNFNIDNGLEVRILPKKFKMGYLEETTDWLLRKNRVNICKREAADRKEKNEKIEKWAKRNLEESEKFSVSIENLKEKVMYR